MSDLQDQSELRDKKDLRRGNHKITSFFKKGPLQECERNGESLDKDKNDSDQGKRNSSVSKPSERSKWWLEKIPENQLCTVPSCTLEPVNHKKHKDFIRKLNLQERKTVLKYLITTNSIQVAKGLKVYNTMQNFGYLTHRSAETLKNCFLRRILPVIESYALPVEVERSFLLLRNHGVVNKKVLCYLK